MGNCPSSFRGKFTPNHESGNVGQADIVLKPVPQDETQGFTAVELENGEEKTIPMIDGVEEADDANHVTNGTHGDALKEAPVDEGEIPPIVEVVDLNIVANARQHHTSAYHLVNKSNPRLIVRRGSSFKIGLTLNRPFDIEKDALCLVFTVKDATHPSYSQNTEILLPVLAADVAANLPSVWQVKILESKEKTLELEVVSSANAVVGEWLLEVDSKLKDDKDAVDFNFKVEDPIIVLFNPWCENDTVFLQGPEKREEYVLCDSGLIWRGTHNCLRPCIWNYGQFEENIIECILYLLTKVGRLGTVSRSDPIRIVRHISEVLNSRNNKGVLLGNWTGKYKGGKSPTCWGGSQMILQSYYKNKKPVKYGQCWVFSGLFTTACRALGIPARAITNFSSAHDTHTSLTIDRFFDTHGEPLEKMNIDSVWSFHVWNEVWMQRPDLEPGNYGGWQAVDSTPQEESDGIYRCGPASVAAIKRGEILKPYDASFLFGEVNADKVYWQYHGHNQPLKLMKKSTDEIGQCISTKAVGKFEREDITHEYKHIESSNEEREVMVRALRQCKNAFSRYYLNDDLDYIQFQFALLDDIVIGSPLIVKLKAINKRAEGEEYNVNVSLRVDSTLYTGKAQKLVKKDEFEIKLGPGVEQEMVMSLKYEDYAASLVDQCGFLITAMASVKETGFDYCAQDDCRVRMPDVHIEVEGEIIQDEPMTVTATLKNPLPKPLKNAEFVIEGPGLGKPLKLKHKGPILPDSEAKVSCKLTPISPGAKTIIAKFASKELEDVDGYHEVIVKPASEAKKNDEKAPEKIVEKATEKNGEKAHEKDSKAQS